MVAAEAEAHHFPSSAAEQQETMRAITEILLQGFPVQQQITIFQEMEQASL